MNGSTLTNIFALAFGVAMVTTIVSGKKSADVITASGKAASSLVLATLGVKA